MSGNPFTARPTSSFGYYRGVGSDGPLAQGQGSRQGPANQGAGMFVQGQGPAPGQPGAWHPTVVVLVVLVIAEIAIVGCIGRLLEGWPFS